MAEISSSGIPDLPPGTLDSLEKGGDPRVLGWIAEAVTEGDRINRSDPSYARIETAMRYIEGDQARDADNAGRRPAYIPGMTINEARAVVQAHVSALTDLKPLFAYKAMNPAFAAQADLINKLTIAGWITQQMDLQLGYVVKYALAAGTGDCVTEWDPHAGFGGDCTLSPRDCRDTLAIRPATHNRSIQAWQGVILRESHTVNVLKQMYPEYAPRFHPTTDSMLATLMGRFRTSISRLLSPGGDTLSALNVPAQSTRVRSGEVLIYRTYLTDLSKNLTTKPIPMGRPGASWAYLVPPGGYLYPYKRLIVSTPSMLLYDGPSPYWHGQYPVSRLKLWDLPWRFLGLSLLHDLLPVQDAINKNLQDFLLGMSKWLDPSVAYNTGAVSENFMRLFDPRRPGAKIKLNPQATKDGFRLQEGPPAQILQLALESLQMLTTKFSNLSGTPNMQELLALRQLPGAETIQRYWEALTPELRQEGRMIEVFLRDLAEQLKVLRFQYESNARRVAVLGDAGTMLEDFDFDPETLVPSMAATDPHYQPEFDKDLPRDRRAQAFHKSIVFMVAPNSILSMNATEGKLIKLQLARAGMYDFWSLGEALEIANIGAPPAIPLPPLTPPDPLLVQQSILMQDGKYLLDPMSGQILEVRIPITVTERLIAQQQLGIGMTESPAGRKASGQAPPQMETKSDGRSTVTESRHDKGPNSQ